MPEILLPTPHAGQRAIWERSGQLNALRCGRRFGKDVFQTIIAGNAAAKGKSAGLFAPEHKQLAEPFDALWEILRPVKRRSSRTEGVIKTATNGTVDFWSLNDNRLAGRGREYDEVLINEAGFTKSPQMLMETWQKAIEPTTLVRNARVWVLSTPAGIDTDNFFYAVCNDPALGFIDHHAPTSGNPLIPAEYLEKKRLTSHPLVFQQEYLAEFVRWDGEAFFSSDKWLDDGKPLPYPARCDGVFAVVDTAIKAGKEHDGTAVVYFATNQVYGTPLLVLDYDLIQIEGDLLETWLPTVFQRCEELAGTCGARHGSLGTWVEDKGSGQVLLMQAAKRGWPAHPMDSKFTAQGKDERAISVSGYHYQGKVKMSDYCLDKLTTFKGATRNHLLTQVTGFRIGDKEAAKRSDDLLDAYVYGLSIGLGNSEGY